MLVDSLGYKYNIKTDKRRPGTIWRCTQRPFCKAVVNERNGEFSPAHDHVCTANIGLEKVLNIRKEVKAAASKRVFDSAAVITEEVMLASGLAQDVALHPTLPNPKNLARQANYARRHAR
ncbi:hypothetical protein ScPMuIL_017309 [Solemya velum]